MAATTFAEIRMPRLSDFMTEGTIVHWLVENRAAVTRGQEIVEIETDKTTMPYAADAAGTISIIAAEGSAVRVGEPIATLETQEPRLRASPVARRLASDHGVDLGSIVGTGPEGRITRTDVEAAIDARGPTDSHAEVGDAPTPGRLPRLMPASSSSRGFSTWWLSACRRQSAPLRTSPFRSR